MQFQMKGQASGPAPSPFPDGVTVVEIGVGAVQGIGTMDFKEGDVGPCGIGEDNGGTYRCSQGAGGHGPARGHQLGRSGADPCNRVDGEERSGWTVVGEKDERWCPEVDVGDVGSEVLEAPPETGIREGEPGVEVPVGVGGPHVEESEFDNGIVGADGRDRSAGPAWEAWG